ncbi:MAG: xanthine dehydrogenase family protein subunit M [Armatimonadota bacterium]|nr:xanthine dehydrogenase family protein subunit M [Armatimonadota bacterium]MDR7422250.1 xanthine dehydrogenase family protein subunit M [Armatimonadota bacterium]MDR7453869.1 xanthine dehydrogenase family protein subunit M [Armatimonadota bacterium]MDR7457568.1 xanthine dehydrogenase family protein subunit M [Armatimonadota bacterium]MDR7495686.1 xanthine dehydrogenase family protein subunit M [Armatimonadota bacterium]
MIPAGFAYHRPRTVQAALRLLRAYGDAAKVLAGGQSLLPMMKLRLLEPAHVVDIGRIASLRKIRVRDGWLIIGALATHWMIESSPAVRRAAPVLAETAGVIGDPQVRNLGTLGGALVHGDPAADYPAVMLALDAEFALDGPDGHRTVPAREFFRGIMTTAADPGELLTEVRLPVSGTRVGGAYHKMPNPASGFALAGAAAVVGLDETGRCAHVRVGVTGVGPAAYRATGVETALVGREPTDELIADAARLATDGIVANEDPHASAEYRLHLGRVMTRRALAAAVERARGRARGGR